jgi:hypothetical protein
LPQKPTLIDGEDVSLPYDDGALDHVLQFTNIAGPLIRLQQVEALLVERSKMPAC